MFCKNCGKEIKEGVKFCPECGQRQFESSGETIPSITKKVDTDGFDFHAWILENNLESYEDSLRTQDLDTQDVLVGLTADDLGKLGIESLGGQKKILNAIQKLKGYNGTNSYNASLKEQVDASDIPSRCPRCGEIWGKDKENSSAGNTLGKALVGGLLLGPVGAVGGAAFGNKTTAYLCRKCGFRKEYKTSIVKGAAKGLKDMLKTI